MFPLNDFNVVCCALATFSAAVGYQYSKRRSLRKERMRICRQGSQRSHFSSDCPAPTDITFEPSNLKRKLRDDDFDNPIDADTRSNSPSRSSSPPQKRLRSSLSEVVDDSDHVPMKVEETSPEPFDQPISAAAANATVIHNHDACAPEVTPPSTTQAGDGSMELSKPPIQPSARTVASYKRSTAFAAFAGASSGFGSSGATTQRPVWCADRTTPSVLAGSSTPLELLPSDTHDTLLKSNATQDAPVTESDNISSPSPDHVLTAQSYTKSTQTNLTGEEDEDVIAELKGVKLWVKRGERDFTDGMYGHVKHLCHRETKEERLVFRRESVWKVAMSVGLRPTVRCTSDEDQGFLRLALKETTDEQVAGSDATRQQVAVYVMRRGRVLKPDFVTFADTVAKSSRLLRTPMDVA
ncbi:unnamed protein product [Somion occarium]|uniref:RanBD1 domain-containing protein n=1 Tax=Somion occarium TaxID=3059160 RepID=A0ABP1E4C4_9APHY